MLYLTLRQYEYAVAVGKAGSISAAAAALNVSQPAVSVAIRTLEEHVGQALFLRGRGVAIRPTGFGQGFLERAEAVLAQAAALEDPQAAGARQVLRLGCFEDLAPAWLAPALRGLREAVPDVQVTPLVADFETLAAQVGAGQLDLAVTYDLGLDASFARVPLARVRPHAYFAASLGVGVVSQGLRLADLADKPLILFEEGLSIRHMLGLFASQGLRPRVAHRVASLEVMRSFAANGEGVGISYATPAGDHSYDGLPVRRVPITDAVAREDIVAVYRADMASVIPMSEVLAVLRRLGAR